MNRHSISTRNIRYAVIGLGHIAPVDAGGMIDSLNRKATERITTRPTPVGIIASHTCPN